MKAHLIANDWKTKAVVEPATPTELVQEIVLRPPPPSEMKKKKPRAYLRMMGWLLVGATCGYFGMHFTMDLLAPVSGPKWLKLLGIAALPFIWLIAAGIHELGHVIGGWIGGGRFLLWMVGPLMVRRTPAGIRAGWNRSVNLSGGMAVCVPRDPARVTPRRAAVMIIGGPVASMLLTIGALWLASWLVLWVDPFSNVRAIGQNIAVFTAVISFLVFLITAAPSSLGGFKSDGKRLFELLRGDHRSEQEAAMLALTSASLTGTRPADYDRALVARAVSLRDGSLFDLYGHLTVYYHAADRGDWPEAQAHLDHVMAGAEKIVPYARDVVRCEYAWLLATQTCDIATARAWLESAGKLEFDPATRLRAEAAVLLADGKIAEAITKARDGLHALEHKSLSPVKSPFAVNALESLLRRAGCRSSC